MDDTAPNFIAFEGNTRIAHGTLADVALRTQAVLAADPQARVVVFHASTSGLIDFDLRGTPEEMLRRLATDHPALAAQPAPAEAPKAAPAGPGRPRLGVVAREVTLLPRHWEWLGTQPGGASVALRKLVDQARRDRQAQDSVRLAQEATYRFMSALAGELPGFEEAARALFSAQQARFLALIDPWPQDVRTHLLHLSSPVFAPAATPEPHHA